MIAHSWPPFNQALDWNDEANEEPATADATPDTAGEGAENTELKDNNITSDKEENEWEKLLRVRFALLTQIISNFLMLRGIVFWGYLLMVCSQ